MEPQNGGGPLEIRDFLANKFSPTLKLNSKLFLLLVIFFIQHLPEAIEHTQMCWSRERQTKNLEYGIFELHRPI